jgi:3-deoxy-D-manno-octulosonic-acid transferase
MSEKSAKKYSKISSLSRQMMSAFELVLAVNARDAERFIRLGVSSECCITTGNIKFDQKFDTNGHESYYPLWLNNPQKPLIWLAASTHKGEDEVLLQAHKLVLQRVGDAKLIIVPRHPERFDDVAAAIERLGFSYARRSNSSAWKDDAQVLLGDTMGELMLAYELADIAFVAGSIVPVGGHNMIEPASLGKPVLSGSYVHNFSEIYRELEQQGGAKTVSTTMEISDTVVELMESAELRTNMGAKAKAVVEQSRGALAKTVKQLEPFL